MKEIGGYFELELRRGNEYHSNALRLNLGRTALELILKLNKVQKIILPYYICEAVLEPVRKLGIDCQFYHIDSKLEPDFDLGSLDESEYFLYINYFGLKGEMAKSLSLITKHLILDNSQAFYSKPIPGIDTFYSARKFFGVPDGAYLYLNRDCEMTFPIDNSSARLQHLLGRLSGSAEKYFPLYKKNEESFKGKEIMKMSLITERLLQNIDYNIIAGARRRNFIFLNEKLGMLNKLKLQLEDDAVPMIYPFMRWEDGLRTELIKRKIFTACYWPDLKINTGISGFEISLADQIISIPLDQRYNIEDLQKMIDIIIKYLKNGE